MNQKLRVLAAVAFLFVAGFAEADDQSPPLDPNFIGELLGGNFVRLPVYADTGVACSADGMDVLASADYGRVYVSHDFGLSWAPTGPMINASDLAMSADGRKMFVVAGGLYQSNDGGASWTLNRFNGLSGQTPFGWSTVKSSADGSVLMVNSDGALVVSTNSGATWSWSLGYFEAERIAMSGDGKVMLAVSYGTSNLRISRDSGATWQYATAPCAEWDSLAISADGHKMIATRDPWNVPGTNSVAELFYVSSDGGGTWKPVSMPRMEWGNLACSADGKTMVAIPWFNYVGSIYLSRDGGESWKMQNMTAPGWTGVACSWDGGMVFASNYYDGIYLSLVSLQKR